MTKALEEIMVIVREMILEIGDLKERVTVLEQALQNPLEAIADHKRSARIPSFSEEEKIRLQGESFDNLGRLYKSGYHVCSMFFGDRHEGECLFCVALLEKR